MTARNQVVVVILPDGEVEATLIVSVNPNSPDRPRYDVYLPNGDPAGNVSKVEVRPGFGRIRQPARTVSRREMWQASLPNGSLLPVRRTRNAALRLLLMALGA